MVLGVGRKCFFFEKREAVEKRHDHAHFFKHRGRTLRVRGADKVMCHLMFSILAITALQLARLVI